MSDPKRQSLVCGIGTSSQGTNGAPRQNIRKGDRSRRMWIAREEEILATCLLDLVANGWKSNNGFRMGYLQKIEDTIRQEFPKSDIQGTPHITSKISAWKKSYGSLRNILSRTGVGFNPDGDHRIDCDDEQWEQIVQADKHAKGMRNKSWPLWETWKIIFGVDRASGGGSEQVDKAAEELRRRPATGPATISECNENDYHPFFDDVPIDVTTPVSEQCDINDNSSANEEKASSTTKVVGQKRKAVSADDALMDFLAKLHAETNSRLDVMSSRIGYEFDLGKARQEVFDKLGAVEGLTLKEKYELCNILSVKTQFLEVFIGMPAHARLRYVTMLLEQNRNGN